MGDVKRAGKIPRLPLEDAKARLKRIGVIDVGSNSVRLVVFDGVGRSPAYVYNEKVLAGLTDLKQVLLTFAREMFGADTKIRLRPSYFPFTEPSAEMDISCNICGGKGCNFCKHTGWVEILGCGMVDPHDLEACGIDSNVYTGYAFGMGVERITNLKYRVSDLRLFSENDTRFLREFESAK